MGTSGVRSNALQQRKGGAEESNASDGVPLCLPRLLVAKDDEQDALCACEVGQDVEEGEMAVGCLVVEEVIQNAAEQEIERIADLVCDEMVEARLDEALEEEEEGMEDQAQQQMRGGQGNLSSSGEYVPAAGNLSPRGTALAEGIGAVEMGRPLEQPRQVHDDSFRVVTGKSKGVRARFPSDRALRSTVRASQNSFQPLPHD
ncbi:uncharacterized protein LOC113748808 [Coffea eugenioides]|uniref:Uncharacterized protein n=1 Tax=Coffea arabica TaxID=13443 RepID=A0ABM4VT64_COFAR|nr:uncharacterized protein LOC113712848 [Coffea arabica]XP_027148171.1 uncharacterized protein LOC113748808 [Coffea eugenioides]